MDEFKRDAVAQVEERGYPVREVAEPLGVRWSAGNAQRSSRVSPKSIYSWQKLFSQREKVVKEVDTHVDEISGSSVIWLR